MNKYTFMINVFLMTIFILLLQLSYLYFVKFLMNTVRSVLARISRKWADKQGWQHSRAKINYGIYRFLVFRPNSVISLFK